MKQPSRIKKKISVPKSISGTGIGLDYCNECPFFNIVEGLCNTSDRKLIYTDINKVSVPQWCGNYKKAED